MTAREAIAHADQRARTHDRPYAVVSERGDLKVWPMQLYRRLETERECEALEVVRP